MDEQFFTNTQKRINLILERSNTLSTEIENFADTVRDQNDVTLGLLGDSKNKIDKSVKDYRDALIAKKEKEQIKEKADKANKGSDELLAEGVQKLNSLLSNVLMANAQRNNKNTI